MKKLLKQYLPDSLLDEECLKKIAFEQAVFGHAVVKIKLDEGKIVVENISPKLISKKGVVDGKRRTLRKNKKRTL